MILKSIRIVQLLLLLMTSQALHSQSATNIRIDESLVRDLQDAGARLHLEGAVIIGDTITLESNLSLRSMNLFLYCNYLQNGATGFMITPYPADTVVYGADGSGLPGREMSVYSRHSCYGYDPVTRW